MNEFKGTPGPWTGMKLTECLPLAHCDQVGLSIGFVNSSCEKRMQEGKANARLIAAAPDLLAACQQALEELKKYVLTRHPEGSDGARGFCVKVMHIEAAIAKALGEKP